MPRTCTICGHQQRVEIDKGLLCKEPLRQLAAQWKVSVAALQRHKADHITRVLARAAEKDELIQGEALLDQLRDLQRRSLAILDEAEATGKLGTALHAIREARSTLELLAKLLGELDDRPQVNLVVAPQWIAVRTALMQALSEHPEARATVAEALAQLESST